MNRQEFLRRQSIRNFLNLALEFSEQSLLIEYKFKWNDWLISIDYLPEQNVHMVIMEDILENIVERKPPMFYGGSLRSCYCWLCQQIDIE